MSTSKGATLSSVLFSSKKDDWRTPEDVVRLVRAVGLIALDPCASPGHFISPKTNLILPGSDGLALSWMVWSDEGLVYVNPPYGRKIRKWTQKIREEARIFETQPRSRFSIIALLPARTDTRWFQEDVCSSADAVCWWRGRITFVGAKHPAPFPSMLVYWGARVEDFEKVFRPHGVVMRNRKGIYSDK